MEFPYLPLRQAGYGRILMVPRVRLAYDKQVFDSKLLRFSFSHLHTDDSFCSQSFIRLGAT